MANREIEARLKIAAVDRASAVLKGLGREIDEIDRRARRMTHGGLAMAEAYERGGARMKAIVGGALVAGVVAAAATARASVVDFAALEREITRIGITAGASDEQIAGVSGQIKKMADDAAMPLQTVYDGFDALVSAGRSWDDALAFLPAVIRTAQAAGAETRDIAQTADALAGSMHIAGGEMQEAFDKLVVGGKLGKFELKDMASYLPSILPMMAALGYTGQRGLEKTVALLQTMRTQTGTAGEAATNLTNVLGKIYSPETGRAFQKNFGVNLTKELSKAKKNGEDLIDAFVRITKKITGGDMEKLAKLFPDAQFRAGVLAVIQQYDQMKLYEAGVKNATGAVENDLNRVTKNAQANVDRLSNSWTSALQSIGRALVSLGATTVLDALAAKADRLANFANDVATKGFGQTARDSATEDALSRVAKDTAGAAYIDAYLKAGGQHPSAGKAAGFTTILPGAWEPPSMREDRVRSAAAAGAAAGRGEIDTPERMDRFAAYRRQHAAVSNPAPSRLALSPAAERWINAGLMPIPPDTTRFTTSVAPPMSLDAQAFDPTDAIKQFEALAPAAKFREMTGDIVKDMADTRQQVVDLVQGMMSDLLRIVGGTPIPPIRIRVDAPPTLARVNPGRSMPDE